MTDFKLLPDLKKIFDKHSVSLEAQEDLKNAFEKMIIKTFYRELGKLEKKVEKIDGICTGIFYQGTAKEKPCNFKAKENGFCSRHDPDKVSSSTAKTTTKKGNSCNFIIKKTNKHCSTSAGIQPEGSSFFYCKRHSVNWEECEK